MRKMITILEDYVRYRDGKKWERRFCLISRSESKKGTVTMFINKQSGINVANQEIDDKSMKYYISDEITGCEHGRHVNKVSDVIALIGRNVVYCIAFDTTEAMLRWAKTLNPLLKSVNFHVTLKKVSETSGIFNKISVERQGNLHVQLNRLCLIGEPSDGNKFIYEWSFENLAFVDICDTSCDKLKIVQIKSQGVNKSKGLFEFELLITEKPVFEDTFKTFLRACQVANSEFKTNFNLNQDSSEISTENTKGYSIAPNKSWGNSENSSSLEKRSSEIPIPRSREHSGPDQRPIDNVLIKIRKSHKNMQKVRNENKKHYSAIETTNKHDQDACLFADDEEIEDQVRHKSQNLLYSGLSQESSGVFVNGISDCTYEAGLSTNMSVQHDSGCCHFSDNLCQSTSSTRHDIDHPVLPQYKKTRSSPANIFLTFYGNVNRNPLSLNNYSNYYRLLTTVLNSRCQFIKRSNSFNCIYFPEIKRLEYSRKYSHTNFPLNLTSKVSDQYFKTWKKKLNNENIEDMFFKMQLQETKSTDCDILSTKVLSTRLPFKSMNDFHCSMTRSLLSGTICFSLFSYHHFLMLLKDVKTVVNKISSKVTPIETKIEYNHWKDKIYRKNKVHNHWLEKMESYNNSYDVDGALIQPSILDVNISLIFEIIDNLLYLKLMPKHGFCDFISRHKSYFDKNPTIELNNDKMYLTGTVEDHLSSDLSAESSTYLESRPLLCMSCSTPDFRLCYPHERLHKLSNIENKYQNISSIDTFDTMNHTFPKQNASLNKTESSHNKEGSFKKLRRKYSPNVFIPFMRRKTSSTHSTLSEPICHNDTKEQSCYYNLGHQRDLFNKKSLSVVLDSCHYVNVRDSHKYINVSKNSGTTESIDSSNYINVDSSSFDDDNVSYPDEILDPSKNYGDLNFIKSRLRYTRQDTENHNCLSFRRSSLSIISQKSLQNFGTSRSVSFSKRGYSNISRVHSDACNNNSNFRSTDYINTKTVSSSPQSLQSCYPTKSHKGTTAPHNLNYVSVMEGKVADTSSHKFTMPLSIYTQNENDDIDSFQYQNHHHKRSLRMTPHSSPVVDYCQIDLKKTYALRDIDRMLYDKMKFRNPNVTSPSSKNGSPEDIDSFKSLDQMPDNYSLSSASCYLEKKSHKRKNKKFFNIFSRRCGSTN